MPDKIKPQEGSTESLFAERYFAELVRASSRLGSTVEPWMAEVLTLLVAHAECFPRPGDEDAYVVEYIYPH